MRLEAEEDTPSVSRFSESGDALVVIDPIDGTLRFDLEAKGPYAVMIGLAIGDRALERLGQLCQVLIKREPGQLLPQMGGFFGVEFGWEKPLEHPAGCTGGWHETGEAMTIPGKFPAKIDTHRIADADHSIVNGAGSLNRQISFALLQLL